MQEPIMANTVLDAFTRGLSRQQGVSAPVNAEDRKRNKKKNNGDRKKVFARCTGQIPDCEAFAQQSCGNDAACLAARTACCDLLSSCDFTAFVVCFNGVAAP
jgi:hypothetical protein